MSTLPLRLAQLTFTLAIPEQYAEVVALVHRARIRLLQFGTITLNLPPTQQLMAVAWHESLPVATLIASSSNPQSAWVRCCALDGIAFSDHTAVLAQLAHVLIDQAPVTTLYYSGDYYDHWFTDILVGVGFQPQNTIIGLQRPTKLPVPRAPQPATLQRLHGSDIAAVQLIDAQAFDYEWRKNDFEIHQLFNTDTIAFHAIVTGQSVAYAIAVLHDHGSLLHIVRIAVLPAWRRQGIAQQLLTAIISYGQQIDATQISLNTQYDNHAALALYHQHGFQQTSDRHQVITHATRYATMRGSSLDARIT
jgi:ribosomal-protein-alanine N-acetyltransferase